MGRNLLAPITQNTRHWRRLLLPSDGDEDSQLTQVTALGFVSPHSLTVSRLKLRVLLSPILPDGYGVSLKVFIISRYALVPPCQSQQEAPGIPLWTEMRTTDILLPWTGTNARIG
jgi:hypothetical protein